METKCVQSWKFVIPIRICLTLKTSRMCAMTEWCRKKTTKTTNTTFQWSRFVQLLIEKSRCLNVEMKVFRFHGSSAHQFVNWCAMTMSSTGWNGRSNAKRARKQIERLASLCTALRVGDSSNTNEMNGNVCVSITPDAKPKHNERTQRNNCTQISIAPLKTLQILANRRQTWFAFSDKPNVRQSFVPIIIRRACDGMRGAQHLNGRVHIPDGFQLTAWRDESCVMHIYCWLPLLQGTDRKCHRRCSTINVVFRRSIRFIWMTSRDGKYATADSDNPVGSNMTRALRPR